MDGKGKCGEELKRERWWWWYGKMIRKREISEGRDGRIDEGKEREGKGQEMIKRDSVKGNGMRWMAWMRIREEEIRGEEILTWSIPRVCPLLVSTILDAYLVVWVLKMMVTSNRKVILPTERTKPSHRILSVLRSSGGHVQAAGWHRLSMAAFVGNHHTAPWATLCPHTRSYIYTIHDPTTPPLSSLLWETQTANFRSPNHLCSL